MLEHEPASVVLNPRHTEPSVPEANLLHNWFSEQFFYSLRYITSPGYIVEPTPAGDFRRITRPLSVRAERARILAGIHRLAKSDPARKVLLEQSHSLDELAAQYLTQGEIRVNLPELGCQTARYTVITPDYPSMPSALVIGGISNPPAAMESLLLAMAQAGKQEIIYVSYPEAPGGSVTPEFASAVNRSPTYGPHAEFFSSAFAAFRSRQSDSDKSMQLWGFSTGGALVNQLLQDDQISRHISHAVVINPASSVDQSPRHLLVHGVLGEVSYILNHFSDLPRYTLSGKRRITDSSDQLHLKRLVYHALLNRVCTHFSTWETSRVRDGGKIVVVSSGHDNFTHSQKIFNSEPAAWESIHNKNPQICLLNLPGLPHMGPLLDPDLYLDRIYPLMN